MMLADEATGEGGSSARVYEYACTTQEYPAFEATDELVMKKEKMQNRLFYIVQLIRVRLLDGPVFVNSPQRQLQWPTKQLPLFDN
jgi:hypothetical protein